MASHNLLWGISPETWGMIPDWEDTIWSTEFMVPGLVYEDFMVDLHGWIPLILHKLLWESPYRQAMQGGGLCPCWDDWVLHPSWIIWGVSWRFNGSACNDKPGSTYIPIPRGNWRTTTWPFTPLWYHLLPHLSPHYQSWWLVVMVYQLELGGLLLTPGSLSDPESESSRCLHIGYSLCASPG